MRLRTNFLTEMAQQITGQEVEVELGATNITTPAVGVTLIPARIFLTIAGDEGGRQIRSGLGTIARMIAFTLRTQLAIAAEQRAAVFIQFIITGTTEMIAGVTRAGVATVQTGAKRMTFQFAQTTTSLRTLTRTTEGRGGAGTTQRE